MTLKRLLATASATLLGATLLVLAFCRETIVSGLRLPSATFAKEFCSCLFVIGQTEAYCRDFASFGFPLYDEVIDRRARSVAVSSLGFRDEARVVNEAGCRLGPP